MPLVAPGFSGEILDLTVSLSRILFPILILLGLSGVVVGILNSYDRFGAFAISPLFWNLTIIVSLIFLIPMFHGQNRIYAYAIGIVIGTVVQLMIPVFDLRNTPFRFRWSFEWRNPDVRRVLLLMLPVTISLGLINFNLIINSLFGSLVSDEGAGGDRQGVPDLPAAAGDLLGRDRDRAVPDPGPVRGPRGDRRPAGDDGERDAPDPLRPGAGGRGDPRPLRTDDPARLRTRRIQRLADDAGRDRALLVRLLAADQRPLPAADPDLLQPPAALGADRDRHREPRRHGAGRARPLPPRRRRDRRRDRDRHGWPASSPSS